MAYFFTTDDNKIFVGGYNQYGNTGTNTTSSNTSYNYSLYPPKEIIYTTTDGTILDGSMVKSIVGGVAGTLLLTNKGEVFATGKGHVVGAGSSANKLIFTRVEVDGNGNKIPAIDKVFVGIDSSFLLTPDGKVYSSGYYSGRNEKVQYTYDVVNFDIEGNPLLPIVDISIHNNYIMFLANNGEVYSFGGANSYGLYDDDDFTNHALYQPKKARVRNIIKISACRDCFFCLDKFGELWVNGRVQSSGHMSYAGKYYDGNNYVPYMNFSKLDINSLYMRYSDSPTKYAFPSKIIDIFTILNYPIVKYLDEEGKVNLITIGGGQKYLGCGTSPTVTTYWNNVKNSTGFWDFENIYTDTLYNLDNNGIACMSKDGKLYVAGGKGTVGGIADKFTAPVVLPNTEGLAIKKVFGYTGEPIQPMLKEELHPMPDVSKAKVIIQNMI